MWRVQRKKPGSWLMGMKSPADENKVDINRIQTMNSRCIATPAEMTRLID